MKIESLNIYPDIADTVMHNIKIPIVGRNMREKYARPDTIRMYITPQENEESDEEFKREEERKQLKRKYMHKRIDRVTKKVKNATGQVKYTVIWANSPEEETVPSRALQDHEDWDLVEHFEYQQAIRQAIKDGQM